MRIGLWSDMHFEMSQGAVPLPVTLPDVDVLILAGDISNNAAGVHNNVQRVLHALRSVFDKPIIYVLGNHEFYGQEYHQALKLLQRQCELYKVTLLEKDSVCIDDVVFFGCTLWSHFLLNGSDEKPWSMRAAERTLADYRAISWQDDRLMQAGDTFQLFVKSYEWLTQALEVSSARKKVVITHFAPHPICVEARFIGDELSPYFVNQLDEWIEKYQPDLWLFGHTHYNLDSRVHQTRLVSNQLGYKREDTGFNPQKVIEI